MDVPTLSKFWDQYSCYYSKKNWRKWWHKLTKSIVLKPSILRDQNIYFPFSAYHWTTYYFGGDLNLFINKINSLFCHLKVLTNYSGIWILTIWIPEPFEYQNFWSSDFKCSVKGYVLCTRPTIWILDQYIRKQGSIHLFDIQMVWLSGRTIPKQRHWYSTPNVERL